MFCTAYRRLWSGRASRPTKHSLRERKKFPVACALGFFFGTLSGIAADPIAAPAALPSAEARAPAERPRGIEDLPWSPMQKLTTDRSSGSPVTLIRDRDGFAGHHVLRLRRGGTRGHLATPTASLRAPSVRFRSRRLGFFFGTLNSIAAAPAPKNKMAPPVPTEERQVFTSTERDKGGRAGADLSRALISRGRARIRRDRARIALSDGHASPGCCCRCVRNSSLTSHKGGRQFEQESSIRG